MLQHAAEMVTDQPCRPLALPGAFQAARRLQCEAGMALGGGFVAPRGRRKQIGGAHDGSILMVWTRIQYQMTVCTSRYPAWSVQAALLSRPVPKRSPSPSSATSTVITLPGR